MTAFIESVALRSVKNHNAQSRGQVLALRVQRQIGSERRELAGGGYLQTWLSHLGARRGAQAIAAHQRSGKLAKV